MRGLALCLVAGALFVAGCGSSDNSAKAPVASTVATSTTGSGQSAAVSAAAVATPASLCTPEGKGKSKKQCTAGLKKLQKGKAKNPRAACKGLSKKKTKGVNGKSPYAVCVAAAAKLMAAKHNTQSNGAADANSAGGSSDSTDTSTDSTDSSGDSTDSLTCFDANGNEVPIDSPDVDSCDDTSSDPNASDSSSADDGSGDTSTDSTDSGN